MPTEHLTPPSSAQSPNDLVKTTLLPGPRRLDDEQAAIQSNTTSPADTILQIIMESIREEFIALRIDNNRELEAGNDDLLHETSAIAGAVFARGRRGEEDAKGRYEFKVLADNCEQQRKVTIDISLTDIQVQITGVAAIDGKDGTLKEIGKYVQHTRPQEVKGKANVDHYLTGKFAPAREGEPLVLIDNTAVRGAMGIDCLGRPIKPRPGTPCQIQTGKGIRKKILVPGKFQLVARRTGLAAPVYNKRGILYSLDVRESLQVSEVGLREGGHIALKGSNGRTSKLEIEETTVDSVGRAFAVRTNGTVNVKETIYGEVLANDIHTQMINAENKLIAARDSIIVDNAVQTSVLRASEITIGKNGNQGSMINSTCRARHNFTASGIRFLGQCTVVLGNDLVREAGEIICGADIFAQRQRIINEQQSLQQQVEDLAEEMRQGLLRQVKQQNNRVGTDHRTLLKKIATGVKAYNHCQEEEEEQLTIKLNNALTDLGTRNTLAFLNLFSTKKQLRKKLKIATSQLAAISPPLAIRLQSVNLNDGAQLTIRCWQDVVIISRVDKEIIISRELPPEEMLRRKIDKFSLDVSYDYQTAKLICADLT